MDETLLKQVLCIALGVLYCIATSLSVKLQCKMFNVNRFLEMSYFLITFFFACKTHSARAMYCLSLVVLQNCFVIIFLKFNPDVFEVTIGAMLCYLW